jgi:hypothetical protein
MICGLALVLLSSRRRQWTRTLVLLGAIVVVLAFLAVCSYVTGLRNATGLGKYTGMAFLACVGFFAAGAAILWYISHRPNLSANANQRSQERHQSSTGRADPGDLGNSMSSPGATLRRYTMKLSFAPVSKKTSC